MKNANCVGWKKNDPPANTAVAEIRNNKNVLSDKRGKRKLAIPDPTMYSPASNKKNHNKL